VEGDGASGASEAQRAKRAADMLDGASRATGAQRSERTEGGASAEEDEAHRAERANVAAAFRRTLGAEVAGWVKDLEPPSHVALIIAPPDLAPALDQTGVPVLSAPEVPAAEAAAMASRLALEEGLLVGPSTGANVVAAYRAAAVRAPTEAILAFALESGERYFSAAMEPRG
jgi:cysteine synthase A